MPTTSDRLALAPVTWKPSASPSGSTAESVPTTVPAARFSRTLPPVRATEVGASFTLVTAMAKARAMLRPLLSVTVTVSATLLAVS